MPDADTDCTLIECGSGNARSNGSWVLGRMMRDYHTWMGDPVKRKTNEVLETANKFDREREMQKPEHLRQAVEDRKQAGLVVSFWEVSETQPYGRPGRDILFWSGVFVSILQLGFAAIPCGLYGDWGVLLVTCAAMVLCLTTGSVGQWKIEKWACRHLRGKKKNFVLTRGNGAQHAIVIISNGRGHDLEDLATGFANVDAPHITISSRLITAFLGIMWVLLLITSSALVDDAWFLIAVGGVGMLQNIFVAGWSRKPEALGVPLEFKRVIGYPKVIDALLESERLHEKVGKSMISTFFPNGLRPHEESQFKAIKAERDRLNESATKE